jgi:hypothetical protein
MDSKKIKDALTLINTIAVSFIAFCVALLIVAGIRIYQASASSPFDDESTHNYWIPDPSDSSKHIVPPYFVVTNGQRFPLGRTLTLNRTVYADIYKEIDCGNGLVWPLTGGSPDRVLQAGMQNRISPSIITIGPPYPPPDHPCIFRVWFSVYRNTLLPPLPVELEPVIIYFKQTP